MKKTAQKPVTAPKKSRISLMELSNKALKDVCGGKGVVATGPERG